MTVGEMRQVVDMLSTEWDLGKVASKATGKICGWIYLFEILEESEQLVLEKKGRKVIGLCGYSNWHSTRHYFRKKWYGFLRHILYYSPQIKNRKALKTYDEDYDYTPVELKNSFDGEVTILMVDEAYRGKGLGKKLMLNTFELAKKDGLHYLEILTDESCNFAFYEAIGCSKVYEKLIPNSEPDASGNISSEMGYIYEKRL